ncbi:MAG: calcium-binding protein [Nitrososphaerales archaeon]
MRSAIIASIAPMLICTMLLGSVLISNVYAKGSGSEKSQYNLNENCKDDHKGQVITLTGDRNVETINTDTNQKTKNKIDTDKTADKDGLEGQKGVILNSGKVNTDETNVQLATKKSDKHFETPDIFFPLNDNGVGVNVTAPEAVNDLIKSKLNQDEDQRIKDTLDYKKSLPLKERRQINVCGLPIGNIVDGFQYNKIDGTKKSDILLGTSAADDISGKDGGDVIQARDDDDIVHGGKGDDSIQAGFGNDNIHADDGDDAVFAGANDDYANGGNGNDELYAQDGDDVLEGGPGADFFDCGMGFDTVVDFNPNEGDITNDNCEDVRTTL